MEHGKTNKNHIFQVSEFNEFVGLYLEKIGEVVVEGEISELKISKGKWVFITIKDEKSSVGVFGMTFKTQGYDLVEEGMKVHIFGVPSLYQPRGEFRLKANKIVPAGEGALKIAFEKLKSKLEKEGLFALERKRKLPVFPEKIGLITAKNSKAYGDFIKVLNNRMGGLKIYFFPVSVQGRNSVKSILAAFDYFNQKQKILDLIVLTRGGGSLEDLQSFNDELVARAVFSSKIPVVCGIGHEDDVSIADLVADVRASTPSNSAELIVRNRRAVIKEINFNLKSIENRLNQQLRENYHAVIRNVNILNNAITGQLFKLRSIITRFNTQFLNFRKELSSVNSKVNNNSKRLIKTVDNWFRQYQLSFKSLVRLLKSFDLKKVLKRGYSITLDENGSILKSIKLLKKGSKIRTTLHDGKIGSKIFSLERS